MYFENLHYFGMPNTKKYEKMLFKKFLLAKTK